MSELKAYRVKGVNLGDTHDVYLKSEADKVIKEKDKEIARLDDLAHAHNIELLRKENLIAELKAKMESVQATAYAESVDAGMENRKLKRALWLARAANVDIEYYPKSEADKVIAHHKYKRCLAMAKWCMARYNEWAAYYPTTTTRKMRFLDKWHKRWLAIAENFKTNSTKEEVK